MDDVRYVAIAADPEPRRWSKLLLCLAALVAGAYFTLFDVWVLPDGLKSVADVAPGDVLILDRRGKPERDRLVQCLAPGAAAVVGRVVALAGERVESARVLATDQTHPALDGVGLDAMAHRGVDPGYLALQVRDPAQNLGQNPAPNPAQNAGQNHPQTLGLRASPGSPGTNPNPERRGSRAQIPPAPTANPNAALADTEPVLRMVPHSGCRPIIYRLWRAGGPLRADGRFSSFF